MAAEIRRTGRAPGRVSVAPVASQGAQKPASGQVNHRNASRSEEAETLTYDA